VLGRSVTNLALLVLAATLLGGCSGPDSLIIQNLGNKVVSVWTVGSIGDTEVEIGEVPVGEEKEFYLKNMLGEDSAVVVKIEGVKDQQVALAGHISSHGCAGQKAATIDIDGKNQAQARK